MTVGRGMNELPVKIESLTRDERLHLLEKPRDSLSEAPDDMPVTPAQQAELERRSDALDQDAARGRALGVSWDEVVRQLRARR
jgi:putative addiction module component (TIGR02574 family)